MNRFRIFLKIALCCAFLAVFPINFHAQGNFIGKTERQLRYHPEGADFVIENGTEFFNRPLYGGNTAFRVDAGDKPEFVLYLPGRGGNLRLGINSKKGAKWLFDADKIITRYRPGSMIYEIQDSFLKKGKLILNVLALNETEGLIIRAELQNANTPVEIVWAYGGVNGVRGRRDGDIGTEQVPISQFFQLKPEFCRDNKFAIGANTFTLESKPAVIFGIAPKETRLAISDATEWNEPNKLLASANQSTETPVVIGQTVLHPRQIAFLALQRLAPVEKSDEKTSQINESQQAKQNSNQNLLHSYKLEDLPRVFDETEKARRAVAEKIVAETPDAFINAAVSALNVAGDAVWDEPQGTFMHGAVAWRSKLLGWRGPYLGDALGWHDRTRRHLTYWAGRQNISPISTEPVKPDLSVNFARNEPKLHTNGDLSNSHYDMNLVYIDALFRHSLWTGDVEFVRQMFPVIKRHLAWERRLYRREFGAEKLPLYEAYAAIWASDDLQYSGGGAAHSTAYNYYHNKMAARIARLIGEDATAYEREADLILRSLRENLWLKPKGSLAEYRDLFGLQRTHESAALWTFYHATDSETMSPFEAWQMSRDIETRIPHIPIRGSGVPKGDFYTLPTTNWMPYTWSTNNVVMAEAMHTSLSFWQAGRNHEAFNLFKGAILDSMFLGICPGNAGMTTYFDMARGEAQRDFADAVGTASRALIEGLFGVRADALKGEFSVKQAFPRGWNFANLRHPDFNFSFRREKLKETYIIEPHFPKPMSLRLNVPAWRDKIAKITVNGQTAKWKMVEDSIGTPRIEIEAAKTSRYEVEIIWQGAEPAIINAPEIVAQNTKFESNNGGANLLEIADPQNALNDVKRGANSFVATATGKPGHRTVFSKVRQGDLTWWQPVMFEIRPPFEILQVDDQDENHLRFSIRNNTPRLFSREVAVNIGGRKEKLFLKIPAFGDSNKIALDAAKLLPGSNRFEIEIENGESFEGTITNWKIKAENSTRFENVNLAPFYNEQVTHIFQNEYLSPRSPFVSLAIPKQGIGSWVHFDEKFEVDDSGLRNATAKSGGIFRLPNGVLFQVPAANDAKNIVFVSQWDVFPKQIEIPLAGGASHIYLLMAGSTNQMQSRFENGEIVVTYRDNSVERLSLENPTNWWAIDQDYFIDDFAFRRPEPIPPRVDLKTGNVRVLDVQSFKGKGKKIPGGAATVLDLPINSNKELKSLTVRALANEVVIGLMSATLVRN